MKSFTLCLGVLAFLRFTMPSFGAEIPFDQAQFAAAEAAGRPVAVVFHADWCPTCRAQSPVLKTLSQEPEFQAVTVFIADFDTATDLKKSLRVVRQSTIVVFKHGKESARSTGATQRDDLAALLRSALG